MWITIQIAVTGQVTALGTILCRRIARRRVKNVKTWVPTNFQYWVPKNCTVNKWIMIYREHVGNLIKKHWVLYLVTKALVLFSYLFFFFFSKNLLPTPAKNVDCLQLDYSKALPLLITKKKRDLRPGNLANRCGLHIQLASIFFKEKSSFCFIHFQVILPAIKYKTFTIATTL